ncbi:MAG TPA: hypothetical protein VFA74_10895 [Terriglobales bacterium]|nr:hypothetical protein [Terriglobales bacterium]
MQSRHSDSPENFGKLTAGSLRQSFINAARFWEPRRLIYNSVLIVVVAVWVMMTWPHFRIALTQSSFLLLTILALLANVCYCAAYLVDIPMQRLAFVGNWGRRALWSLGMLFAAVLANYWIADEIYPFVH